MWNVDFVAERLASILSVDLVHASGFDGDRLEDGSCWQNYFYAHSSMLSRWDQHLRASTAPMPCKSAKTELRRPEYSRCSPRRVSDGEKREFIASKFNKEHSVVRTSIQMPESAAFGAPEREKVACITKCLQALALWDFQFGPSTLVQR